MKRGTDRRWLAPALTLACLLLRRPVELACGMLIPPRGAVWAYLAAGVGEAVLWLLPALLLLPWRTRRLGAREDVLPSAVLALPMGVLIQLGMLGLRRWLPAAQRLQAMPVPQTAAEWLLALLLLAAVPAVCEEAFFRGGLLGCLRDRMPPAAAFGAVTAIFALMHGSLSGLPGHLLVSACCTLLMMNTGRVYPGMLLHMGYNAAALAAAYLPQRGWMAVLLLIPLASAGLLALRTRWTSANKHVERIDLLLLAVVAAASLAGYLMP